MVRGSLTFVAIADRGKTRCSKSIHVQVSKECVETGGDNNNRDLNYASNENSIGLAS